MRIVIYLICFVLMICMAPVNMAAAQKTIIVGGETDYPPYCFLDENGLPTGFQVDLTRSIARVMGMEIEINLSAWADVRKRLENGTIDIICGMFYSDDRAEIYDFSPPYTIVSSVIFARRDAPSVQSIDDLRDKEIIVMRGEAMHDLAVKQKITQKLILAETPEDVLKRLAAGKGDYALGAQMPGLYWIDKLGLSNITTMGKPLEPFKNCFSVHKGNTLLLSQFTEGLLILQQTGEYQKLYQKWFGVFETPGVSLTKVFKYVAAVFLPLLMLLVTAFVWSWTLRRSVARRTLELSESRQQILTLSDNLPDGYVYQIVVDGEQRRFTFVSAGVEHLHGISASDVLADPMLLYGQFIEEDRRLITEQEALTQESLSRVYMEVRYRRPSGEIRWLLITSSSRRLPDQSIATDGLAIDITERKEAEKKLQEITKRLNLAMTSAKAGVWDWSIETNEMTWDDRMLELYGLTLETFPGGVEAWEQGLHPDDASRAIAESQTALRGERDFDTEFRVRHPDGTIVHIQANGIVLFDDKGKPRRMIGLNIDITERKKVENALRESENLYRKMIENSLMGMLFYRLENNGQLIFNGANPEADKLLRVDNSIFIGKTIEEVFPSLIQTEVPARYRDAAAKGIPWSTEQIVYKDTKISGTFEVTAFQTTPGHMVAVFADITERKQTEEALRESEKKYRTLTNNLPDIIYTLDSQAKIVTVNAPALNRYGYEKQDAEGRTFLDFIHPEDRDIVFISLFNGIREQQEIRMVPHFRLMAANGDYYWFELNARAQYDNQGLYTGEDGVLRDITERKQSQDIIRENIARFKALFNATSDSVILISTDGTILDLNENAARRRDMDAETMLGGNLFDFLPPEAAALRRKAVARVVKDRALVQYEEARNGKQYSISLFPVINDTGIVFQVAGFSRDITELKKAQEEKARLEDQFHQAQKMESIGRLAGGVAHDFNNMLMIILSYSEMALDEVDPSLPLFSDLTEILKAANRSADLTQQLLAFARKQVISPKVIDLDETVGGMLKMLRRLIGEDIGLSYLPGADLWPVKVDPTQIDQILANLCVNARDAIADVGSVAIETKNVAFDESYCAEHPGFFPGEFVLLAVSDSGEGIDKEMMGQIFEPFFTTKELGKGTGLGLATVYGIVKQNNGFINVYSEPGHGTIFKIYLPRHASKALQMRKEGLTELAAPGDETILLVDDEEAILTATTKVLERKGYTVLTANTPGEAIRLAMERAGDIHLLMTDVIMPEMNGRDLAKNILSLYPNLKCLFMSGYTANVIAHRGVLDAGVQFIQKPFSGKDLYVKIREALGGGG